MQQDVLLHLSLYTMNLLDKFLKDQKPRIAFAKPSGLKFLLAVSGGVDSVVMTDLFYKAGFDFEIAHCNFQLRGEESERDETFVRKLAAFYNKPVIVERFDTKKYAEDHKVSIQVAARELRYKWFGTFVFPQQKFAGIITAHHGDDNIETVLMNLFRGTGLKGLTGIPAQQFLTLRPLLNYRRQEIVDYAKENNLDYVEDSSNNSSYYTRNFFRNELLPVVRKVFPQAEENVLMSIAHFKDAEEIYSHHIHQTKEKLLKRAGDGEEKKFAILDLKKLHPLKTWVWEIFKEYGFTPGHTEEIIKLMDAANGAYLQTEGGYRMIRNRKWLVLSVHQISPASSSYATIDKEDKTIRFAGGKIDIEMVDAANVQLKNAAETALVDAAKISFPLMVRPCKQGDYFYPLGMQKKKKLNRFFIDQKLSAEEKKNVWVVESDKKIIWVIGMRIDDRFKVLPSSKQVLKLTWSR